MSKQIALADECSGITILDDGTKAYWTEGRSTDVVIRHPDGRTERLPVYIPHPLLAKLERLDEEGHDEYLEATEAEEAEWEAARNS